MTATNSPPRHDRRAISPSIWLADTMTGADLTIGGRRVWLHMLLDSISATPVGFRWDHLGGGHGAVAVLRSALAAYPVPHTIHTDFGAAYTSAYAVMCGRHGIRLVRSRDPRLLLERIFGRVQRQFVHGLGRVSDSVTDIEHLNQLFAEWLDSYQDRLQA
ncbi:integrase catalytic domain-containing protein [Nonomuraea turcica]|uniref:integrase catalytic domain-containing protein n=1 Tax=Nonomuraea sp. G32 TaxID=3067274 RepID=UPI00273B92CC|nr:transposase family protein [Nonomuraea sp. G32]MDP4512048.1 transposase family protein [Nonomuraea sp. G32]